MEEKKALMAETRGAEREKGKGEWSWAGRVGPQAGPRGKGGEWLGRLGHWAWRHEVETEGGGPAAGLLARWLASSFFFLFSF